MNQRESLEIIDDASHEVVRAMNIHNALPKDNVLFMHARSHLDKLRAAIHPAQISPDHERKITKEFCRLREHGIKGVVFADLKGKRVPFDQEVFHHVLQKHGRRNWGAVYRSLQVPPVYSKTIVEVTSHASNF